MSGFWLLLKNIFISGIIIAIACWCCQDKPEVQVWLFVVIIVLGCIIKTLKEENEALKTTSKQYKESIISNKQTIDFQSKEHKKEINSLNEKYA